MAEDKNKKGFLFGAGMLLLFAGPILALLDKPASALLIVEASAGLCFFFVFLDKFEFIKFWGAEGRLRREVKEDIAMVSRRVKDLPLKQEEEQKLKQLVAESPRRIIDNAWNELEGIARASLKISFATSPEDVAVNLKNSNFLPDDKYRLFEDMLSIRNKIIHNDRKVLNSSTAIDYAEAAHKLTEYIEQSSA